MSVADLAPAARLLAWLMLREPDAALLRELGSPEIAAALAAAGVELPSTDALEEVHAEFFAVLLHPERSAPPIASLWLDGQYEGDTAVAVRALASESGLDFDPEVAGGAPVDHLGSLLLLWSESAEAAPEVATRLAADYLGWVDAALHEARGRPGFYGSLSRAVCAMVAEIRGAAVEHGPSR
ncbi:MAG: molecular chaperone TorD family protein [Planctomycetes bacterium]|nr:molecular chaperone TorD family protein [Planctomycetota bacterium]MCB9887932.1 molecular chaperone TorD family protein [Planctomycetota bacterium]